MSFRYSWLMEISMIRNFLLGIGLTGLAMAAGKLELKDLPPAVRKTVEAETKGATIKNIVKEKEKGKTVYEVETMVNGKSRDIVVDSTGALETVEEQADLDSFPTAAKAAILKEDRRWQVDDGRDFEGGLHIELRSGLHDQGWEEEGSNC